MKNFWKTLLIQTILCPILAATEKFKRYSSILKTKGKAKIQNKFCFKHITCKEVKGIINDINTKSATQKGNLPVKVIKEEHRYFFPIITNLEF